MTDAERADEWMRKCELAQKRADDAEKKLAEIESEVRPRLVALNDTYERLRVEMLALIAERDEYAKRLGEMEALRSERDAAIRRLRRLAEGCRTRNVDRDWPALSALIDQALGVNG